MKKIFLHHYPKLSFLWCKISYKYANWKIILVSIAYQVFQKSIQSKNFELAMQKWEKCACEKMLFGLSMLICFNAKSLKHFETIIIATCSLTCYLKIDKCTCKIAITESNHYHKKDHISFLSIIGSHKTEDITIITLTIKVQ